MHKAIQEKQYSSVASNTKLFYKFIVLEAKQEVWYWALGSLGWFI